MSPSITEEIIRNGLDSELRRTGRRKLMPELEVAIPALASALTPIVNHPLSLNGLIALYESVGDALQLHGSSPVVIASVAHQLRFLRDTAKTVSRNKQSELGALIGLTFMDDAIKAELRAALRSTTPIPTMGDVVLMVPHMLFGL